MEDNPLISKNPLIGDEDITATATGRRQYKARSIEDNLAKLKEARAKATDPTNIKRLDAFIADLERQKGGSWTRGSEKPHGDISNTARGVAAGVAGSIPGALDLAAVPFDLLGFKSADEFRRYMHENQETTREYFDPGGKAGLAGEVAGGIAGSAIPFGGAASATAKGAERVLGLTEKAAALKASSSIGKRIATNVAENVVGGLPINTAQAAGMKESSTEDKLKQLAIGTGGDVLFGAAHGARTPKGSGVKPVEGAKPVTPTTNAAADAAKMVAEGQRKIDARAAIEALVEAKWQEQHPDLPYSDVSKEARKRFRASIKDQIDAARKGLDNGESGGESAPPSPAPLKPQPAPGSAGSSAKSVPPVEGVSSIPAAKNVNGEILKIIKNGENSTASQIVPDEVRATRWKSLGQAAREDGLDRRGMDKTLTNKPWTELSQADKDKLRGVVLSSDEVNKDLESIKPPTDRITDLKQKALDNTITPDEKKELQKLIIEEVKTKTQQVKDGTYKPSDSPPIDQHPDLDESAIAKDWNQTHPDSRANYVGEEYSHIEWDKLPEQLRKEALEQIREERKADIDENGDHVLRKFDVDPADGDAREVLDQAAYDEIKPLHTTTNDFNDWWSKLTPELKRNFSSIEEAKSHFDNLHREQPQGGSVSDELRGPSADIPDDIRGELTDLLIDYHTEHWTPEQLDAKLEDFAARNEVTRKQVDFTLQELGLDQHAPNQNIDKSIINPLLDPAEAGGTKPEPSTLLPDQRSLPDLAHPTDQAESPLPVDYGDLSTEELDATKEQLFKALEASPGDPTILGELDKLAAETRQRDAARIEGQSALRHADEVFPDVLQDPTVTKLPDRAPEEPARIPMDPKVLGKLARSSPSKLSDAEIDALIDETGYRIADLPMGESDDWKKLQDKLLAEKSRRRPPPLDARMPPGVAGAAIGFTYGLVTQQDQDDFSRILMMTAVGGLAAYGGSKLWNTYEATKAARLDKPEMYPGQHTLPKFIQYEADKVEKRLPLMARARHFYAGVMRGTGGGEDIANKLGGGKLPAYNNFSQLAAIFGRWVAISDHWQTRGPVMDGPDGNPVAMDALSLAQIKDIAQGDIENLDELAVAATTLENYGKKGWKPPIDLARAQLIYSNAPPHLHQAAQEMRKYFLALTDVLVNAGVVSAATREKFAQEAYYTALHRVVGESESESWIASKINQAESIASPNPVKPRKGGSTLKVKSPFEIASEMTARYIRAAEFNKVKQEYLAFSRAQPPEVRAALARRVDKKQYPALGQVQALADALKAELPTIDPTDAQALAAGFGGKLDSTSPELTVYEEGVLRQYKVNDAAFDMFRHLMPSELNAALYFIGGPTRLAAKGIVYNPFFIQSMEFINTFQAALQSKYGFVPFVDSFKGWWAAMSNSPEYQKLLAAGGPATIQSLSAVDKATARSTIEAASRTQLGTVGKLIKEMHPWEAYKALVLPVAEASRIGEGLRALAHGESAIQAVYDSWHVVGNTRMQGNFAAMRAFNLLTLFSRPALSAIDEAVVKTGLHPFRRPTPSKGTMAQMLGEMGMKNDRAINGIEFASKGFAYLTMPTALLWYLNKDDQEIQQLRQTESGRRYWYHRFGDGADDILKIRKPHILGQVFGSTVEDLLDKSYGQNPSTVSWLGGLANDAALNILPQIGVIPISLWANKQVGLGSPITPRGDEKLMPSMQGDQEASNPARIVSKSLDAVSSGISPSTTIGQGLRTAMSPAGVDYVVNTTFGMLGQDGLRTVDWFMNQQKLNMPPTKSELPVVGRLFAKYPTMNTRSVRDFYQLAGRVEEAQRSFNELLQHKPQLATQFQARHQQELALASLFETQRTTIANYRRMIEDMKFMTQNGRMTPEEFKRVEGEVLKRITQIAQITVQSPAAQSLR